MNERDLFMVQRATAGLMAPFVVLHLLVILYAMRGGLTADEILSRTQGSVGWALFYGAFVALAAVHAPIGVRSIVREWTVWRSRSLDVAVVALGLVLLVTGLRAVLAVVS